MDRLLSTEPLRYRLYGDAQAIIADLPKLCGLVSLSVSEKASIESYVRHELKNMPGWDYERAQALILPPCEDCDVLQLPLAMHTMLRLQSGEWNPTDTQEPFSPASAMSRLVAHMRIPEKALSVTIVDDEPKEIRDMSDILTVWPNITLTVCSSPDSFSVAKAVQGILLLDEDLGKWHTTGTKIFNHLNQHKLLVGAVVASTTSGNKPPFARWHFGAKGLVSKSFEHALGFVQFMNRLIRELP